MSGHKATQTDGGECRKEPGRWCSTHASLSLGVLPSMLVSCSYTCLYRDCVYLVKKHCQAPCMRVNRSFLLGTQSRKGAFLLAVKGDTVLCTGLIKSHLVLISGRAHKTLLRLCWLPKLFDCSQRDSWCRDTISSPSKKHNCRKERGNCTLSGTCCQGRPVESGYQPALKLPCVLPGCLPPPPGSGDLLIGCSLPTCLAVKGQHVKYLQFSRPLLYVFHKCQQYACVIAIQIPHLLIQLHPPSDHWWIRVWEVSYSHRLSKSVELAIHGWESSGSRADLILLLYFELQEIQEDLLLD